MTATRARRVPAVLEIVTYLDDVAEELRLHGISVESTTLDIGPPMTARLATDNGVTLTWHRIHGWSPTGARPFPLRLPPTAPPDEVATLAVLLSDVVHQAGSA